MNEIERVAANTPQNQISLGLNYETEFDLRVNLSGRYVGKKYNYYSNYSNYPVVSMDTKELSDYFVSDFKITQLLAGNIDLFVGVDNIFDVKYKEKLGSSITDSKETIASRLTETVLRFFTENLDRKEEDWKREVEQLVDNTAMCIEILRRQLHTYSDAGFTEALAGLKEKLQSLGLKEADVPNLSSERVDSVVQALRTRITSEINTAIGLITKE